MKKIAHDIFSLVKKEGGTAARFIFHDTSDLEVSVRDGGIEKKDSGRRVSFTITVWIGERVAGVSGNDISLSSLRVLVKQACDIARMSEPDPYTILAPRSMWPLDGDSIFKQLNLCDNSFVPTMNDLMKCALEIDAENNTRSGISTSGASVYYRKGTAFMITTEGFELSSAATSFSAFANCVAKQGEDMSSGDFGDGARHFSDLLSFEKIGKTAGDLSLQLIGAKPIPTGSMPIVLSRMSSDSLLGHFASAITGENVFKKRSFLKESLSKRIFSSGVTIIDDPLIPRLLGSGVVDSECTARQKIMFVKDGVLTRFATNRESAAKLGCSSTGHANGFGNLYMENGKVSPEELMADIKRGVYVVDFIGHGPNIVTGDYSRGVRGFLIENGKITRPIQGVTVAGNLSDMFMNLSVANDLDIGRYNAPTIRIDGMTIAGEQP